MPRGFRSQLTTNIIITLAVFVVLLTLLLLVMKDIKTQATTIKTAKNELKTRVQQLNDLARLREETKLAEPNLAKLEAAVPVKDELFSVRREMEQLAAANNLAVNFTFGNENPKEANLGSINFEMKLQGGDFNIRNFVNQVESKYPFVRITGLDMVRQENDFSASLSGKILFSQ